MFKKLLVVAAGLTVVLSGGLYFWAQSIFASEPVRAAVERQISSAIGQPVRIGSIGATVLPRVTMILNDVRIGEPARITATRLDVGASLGALLSRRIEQGSVHLEQARIELPLPPFAFGEASGEASATAPPVEIVSIDDITLSGVEIVSGGRTLRGDVNVAARGASLTIQRATFLADGTAVGLTGRIDDLAGPTGELALAAQELDVVQLLGFVSDFAPTGLAPTADAAAPQPAVPDVVPMNLVVSLDTGRATFGTLVLDALTGRARLTDTAATIDPIRFNVFGGQYDGTLALTLDDTPGFTLNAALANVDLAALTTFAGHPDLVTGRFTGRLDVTGRGTTPDLVIRSTSGTARIDAVDGAIKGLGLVRAVVIATSMRAGAARTLADAGASAAEPFTRMGATLAISGGTATTKDLRFESRDLLLDAAGALRLDGSDVTLAGQVQLSDELTKQAGRDFVRYTSSNGRVTLPATVRGSADSLQVGIDTTTLLRRAITNRANEEVQNAIKKGLGGIFGR